MEKPLKALMTHGRFYIACMKDGTNLLTNNQQGNLENSNQVSTDLKRHPISSETEHSF